MGATLESRGLEARRTATLRIGAYALCLTAATGLGLFYVAGVRGAQSWGVFALMSLGALVSAARLISSAWATSRRITPESPVFVDSTGDGVASTEEGGHDPADAAADDVDYLMALRHEFRTPLNAVLGFSDVLLSGIDGEVNESQREDLEIIRASGIRLRILLDCALDLSLLADGELRLDVDRADVRELVARVAIEAGQLWSNKRAAVCALPDVACTAAVDEGRVRRSILVLADFLATEHRDATIRLSLDLSDEHAAIEITAEDSERLTLSALPTPAEVLAAEDAAEIRRWPVAVTSEIIARHSGSLYHGDAPSRFRIRLPLRGES